MVETSNDGHLLIMPMRIKIQKDLRTSSPHGNDQFHSVTKYLRYWHRCHCPPTHKHSIACSLVSISTPRNAGITKSHYFEYLLLPVSMDRMINLVFFCSFLSFKIHEFSDCSTKIISHVSLCILCFGPFHKRIDVQKYRFIFRILCMFSVEKFFFIWTNLNHL